jgi:hypothetical protein
MAWTPRTGVVQADRLKAQAKAIARKSEPKNRAGITDMVRFVLQTLWMRSR